MLPNLFRRLTPRELVAFKSLERGDLEHHLTTTGIGLAVWKGRDGLQSGASDRAYIQGRVARVQRTLEAGDVDAALGALDDVDAALRRAGPSRRGRGTPPRRRRPSHPVGGYHTAMRLARWLRWIAWPLFVVAVVAYLLGNHAWFGWFALPGFALSIAADILRRRSAA